MVIYFESLFVIGSVRLLAQFEWYRDVAFFRKGRVEWQQLTFGNCGTFPYVTVAGADVKPLRPNYLVGGKALNGW